MVYFFALQSFKKREVFLIAANPKPSLMKLSTSALMAADRQS
jgi:hypothetical protein